MSFQTMSFQTVSLQAKPRFRLVALFLAAACLFASASSYADVLTTKSGLVLEGSVAKDADAGYRVTTDAGVVHVKASEVLSVQTGVSPRAAWIKAFEAASSKAPAANEDQATAMYKLAVRADAEGLDDLARRAHLRVVALNPNHRASRRALGHELVKGNWLTQADARRAQGLVLFRGTWRTAEEVERLTALREGAKKAPASDKSVAHESLARSASPASRWLETAVLAEPALRAAAERALHAADSVDMQAAGVAGLAHKDVRVRAAAAKLLGELGDEASLRPLILTAARDKDEDVRREATLAAMAFGHDDVSIPFVRALGASNPKIVANAAQALGMIGDMRAVGYVVKRMMSAGSSTRNFIAITNQISYVRDYDVEIAQASNIANPDIGTIQEGVVLDAKVAGLYYTRTWIEPILVDAAGALAGERFRNRDEVLAWYAKNKASIPSYPPKPGKRLRKKRRGRWIGVPNPTR